MIEPDDDETEETLAECPKCGAEVYDDIEKCPHCGEWIDGVEYTRSRSKRMFVAIVALVVLAAFCWHWLFR